MVINDLSERFIVCDVCGKVRQEVTFGGSTDICLECKNKFANIKNDKEIVSESEKKIALGYFLNKDRFFHNKELTNYESDCINEYNTFIKLQKNKNEKTANLVSSVINALITGINYEK